MTQVRVWAAFGVAVVLLAGCRVDTRVEVTMHRDGTGVVQTTLSLDAEALRELGGLDAAAKQVPVADLRGAGWKVSAWRAGPAGSSTVTLTHTFRGQDDLGQRLADLVGRHGVLRDPRITRDHGWFTVHDALTMVVDLRAPTSGIGSDADLRSRIKAAGLDPATLDAQMTAQLRSALHLVVVLHLPNGQTRTYDGANGSFTMMRVSHSHTDYDRMVKFGIALMLVMLAGVFMLAARVSARRERRRSAQRVRTARIEHERAPLM